MHFLMLFGAVLGLFVVCDGARDDQECSTLSTVYVAVPVVTTVTETVDFSGYYTVVGADINSIGFPTPTSFSEVISIPQLPSFSEAISVLQSTVIPADIPFSSVPSVSEILIGPPTSTVGRVINPSFASAGSSGWNGTTLRGVKHTRTCTGSVGSSAYAVEVSGISTPHFTQRNSLSIPTPLKHQNRNKYARQVGVMVTATINGVVVSWTNSYDGIVVSTPPPSSLISSSSFTGVPISGSVVSLVSSLIVETTSVLTPYEYSLPPVATSVASTESSLTQKTISSIATVVSTLVTITHIPVYSSSQSPVGLTASSFSTAVWPSTGPFLNATTTSSELAAPTDCGLSNIDVAEFEITFDDLPIFKPYAGETDWPPISNPYYNLFWASGFAYAPLPGDPYVPVSQPYLAVFNSNATVNSQPPDPTDDNPPSPAEVVQGEFGAGQNFANSSFWFNVYSAYVGCTDAGPVECTITANGLAYEPKFGNVVPVARQTFTQPPCPSQSDCPLLYIELNDNFLGLSDFQLVGSLGDSPVSNTWYIDNLSLGWNDTSCRAANIRAAYSHRGK